MVILTTKIYYPAFALCMLFLLLAFVPRQVIRKLFWFSLLWGSTIDAFLIMLFKYLNLYRYVDVEPFNFFGAPMWLSLSWSPAVILFLYFLPPRKEWYYFVFYLAAFSTVGTAIAMFFTQAGLIKEFHWNELLRFPIQFLWFYGTAKHFQYLESTEHDTWR